MHVRRDEKIEKVEFLGFEKVKVGEMISWIVCDAGNVGRG
jgi:hypothetical protein